MRTSHLWKEYPCLALGLLHSSSEARFWDNLLVEVHAGQSPGLFSAYPALFCARRLTLWAASPRRLWLLRGMVGGRHWRDAEGGERTGYMLTLGYDLPGHGMVMVHLCLVSDSTLPPAPGPPRPQSGKDSPQSDPGRLTIPSWSPSSVNGSFVGL